MNQQVEQWAVVSPSSWVGAEVCLSAEGRLSYRVHYRGRSVLADSPLALDLRPGGLLRDGLALVAASRQLRDVSFPIVAGKASQGRDHCNELVLQLQEHTGLRRRIDMVFRAYDDGIAFRYRLPEQSVAEVWEIVAEHTDFVLAENYIVWALQLPNFQTPFESEFNKRRAGELLPGSLTALPLTLELGDGAAAAITEAGLSDHAGMYLAGVPGSVSTLRSVLAPLFDGTPASVRCRLPHASPWRVIQVAASPVALIESNIVHALNEPCAIADTSWIRPGKVTWDWWCGHPHSGKVQSPGMNNETMMDFIDFAAEMQLEYMLIDGGWYEATNVPEADVTRQRPGIDLPALVEYANGKGVQIMVWTHQADLKRRLEEAFSFYESLGVKGVKVDFFDRDDQATVQWAQQVVECGARHRLLVDLHGIFKPTGIERTYPNLMTHEGIMGAEYNKWSTRVTPEHNVTIPFTRMLAGPMDYTPGSFCNTTREQFRARNVSPMVMGTRAHNLAMYVVYQSALQMVSDAPDGIRSHRGSEFLKVVPASWDQTVGVDGAIGEYVVVARRKGRDWFIGAMTNSMARELAIPLSFLGEGQYEAQVFADGLDAAADPTSIMIRQERLSASDTLPAKLAPAGGMAAWLKRVD